MALELPALPYAYDALAPVMSAETLEFHHDKHHNAYVVNGNKLLEGSGLEGKSLEEIVVASYGDASKVGLFNNAAQHWNHIEFWQMMKKNGGGNIPGELEKKIVEDFGSVDAFKEAFIQAGVTQFGSGWCWLALDKSGKLVVTKTPNAENPLVHGQTPLLGCDVWEHSYYIDYRNARPDYVKAFINDLVNWEYVAERFSKAG
ncbi:superoxide dismutase [Thalassospira xiamenensis]|uniref:superoxide dismutase n=2 Tax=Thalassospira TaxID=168934 RepID=UPI000C5DAE03|nr:MULTISPECIES: superoxide dismutase [Thalassospira]MAZ33632.1 superoxide dismutase [Thalassospira sp.]RCK35587.1 superoxide dismutase [Thalassospira xiamenensis]|tara:strand:+ start:52 stop:657 length:606 start_codon:yes stop_codon:yes gene_type:complete